MKEALVIICIAYFIFVWIISFLFLVRNQMKFLFVVVKHGIPSEQNDENKARYSKEEKQMRTFWKYNLLIGLPIFLIVGWYCFVS